MHGRHCRVPLAIKFYLVGLLFAGCSETTLTPTFRATKGLPRPDRVLVFDFAVTPKQAGLESGPGAPRQTGEDVRVGTALAQALAVDLVRELRGHGIEAERAGESAAPGDTTASVRGSFLRTDRGDATAIYPVGFAVGGGQVRTRVQLFQGTGLNLQLVGEGQIVTPSGLKPGAASEATIEADAKRTAQALVERITDYYRQEGWIK
jgi:hypothetical protein